jgi:hypothetical protein
VLPPEDPYPVWDGPGGPVTVAPLFVLYDYSFLIAGTHTRDESLAVAEERGVVCTDDFFLHPDPDPTVRPGAGRGLRRANADSRPVTRGCPRSWSTTTR